MSVVSCQSKVQGEAWKTLLEFPVSGVEFLKTLTTGAQRGRAAAKTWQGHLDCVIVTDGRSREKIGLATDEHGSSRIGSLF